MESEGWDSSLFEKEEAIIRQGRKICKEESLGSNPLFEHFKSLTSDYGKLLHRIKSALSTGDNLEENITASMLLALIKIGKSLSAEKDHDKLLRININDAEFVAGRVQKLGRVTVSALLDQQHQRPERSDSVQAGNV